MEAQIMQTKLYVCSHNIMRCFAFVQYMLQRTCTCTLLGMCENARREGWDFILLIVSLPSALLAKAAAWQRESPSFSWRSNSSYQFSRNQIIWKGEENTTNHQHTNTHVLHNRLKLICNAQSNVHNDYGKVITVTCTCILPLLFNVVIDDLNQKIRTKINYFLNWMCSIINTLA